MTRLPRPTSAMAEILRLTRRGKLADATALIQQSLQGGGNGDAPDPVSGDVLEGTFSRLPDVSGPKGGVSPGSGTKIRRAGLGETLRSIAAGGMPGRAPLTSRTAHVAKDATFGTRTHHSAAGSRDYRLYIPSRGTDTALPVIVMLHGCTQTPEDFALGTGMNVLAEEFGCIIVYPAQSSGANMQKCWNWFRPEDQARGQGEPALLASLTQEVIAATRADASRVYVAGLSAGGAAAATLAAAYPDVFSAVGVHSGLPIGAARDVASAFAAMRNGAAPGAGRTAVPTISFHGLADTTVHPTNGRLVVKQALREAADLRMVKTSGATNSGRTFQRMRHEAPDGKSMAEQWEIDGAAHAWSGGNPSGSYTDPAGPDASREMIMFFLQHRKPSGSVAA